MFQEPSNERTNANVLGQPWNTRSNATESTNNQIDLHSRFAGAIERIHHAAVFDLIHLGNDSSWTLRCMQFNFTLDQFNKSPLHADWSDQQFIELRLSRTTCHVIEKSNKVFCNQWITGQDAEVLIDACGSRVVISGSDMAVATNAVRFLTNDKSRLGVRLQTDHAVCDMHSSIFQFASPFNIACFVEACAKFDQHCDLFSTFGGVNETCNERTVTGSAIQRLLDTENFRIIRSSDDELFHTEIETLIRMMNQNIAFANLRKNARSSLGGKFGGRKRSPTRIFHRWKIHVRNCIQNPIVSQSGSFIYVFCAKIQFFH